MWTPLEAAANLMTVVCIFLAGRNSVHTWWTGIVASVLFGALFWNVQLYADVTLQGFFIWTSLAGWILWAAKRKDLMNGKGEVPVTPINRASTKKLIVMLGSAVLVAGAYGFLLHKFTNAYAPWIDSLVLTLSVVAQLLLVARSVQNWPVWVAVNALSVPLYWSRELYMTSILYSVFFVHALWAWKQWLNEMDAAKSAV